MRVPETIKTLKKIVSKYDVARLVIGGYGPEKEQCRDIVDNSSTLLEKVSFYDVKSWDEIPDVFEKCDVLINFASYSPGAGVILSSVASGMESYQIFQFRNKTLCYRQLQWLHS